MIIAINYANEKYSRARKLNSITAKFFGRVDKVISYFPNDLDEEFKREHSEILSIERGNGCWLWKPYFIKKTLEEMQEGDFLIYTDSGMCYIKGVDALIQKMKETNQDIFLTDIPLLEVQYTHPEVLRKLNGQEFKFSNQIQGAPLIVRKTASAERFINDWLILCQDRSLLIADSYGSIDENLFIAHREDQSILSILAKKNGIKPFTEVSDYGLFPLQYLESGRIFRLQYKESQYTIKNTYFLLFRKEHPFLYMIKFLIKIALKEIGLQWLRKGVLKKG